MLTSSTDVGCIADIYTEVWTTCRGIEKIYIVVTISIDVGCHADRG